MRVLHLVGSAESELLCDLSRLYALGCLEATADPARYESFVAYITPDRRWRFPVDLSLRSLESAPPMALAEAVAHLTALEPHVVVPQMFCRLGMTSYRALFDVLGIPYVGNTPDVMGLGMNKAKARAVVSAAGVPVPRGEVLSGATPPTLPPPVVVKPVDADNSLGVTLVRDQRDYAGALDAARTQSDEVLVESYVELGREVRCGIVVRGGELVCLPLEEYAVGGDAGLIRTYDDKLRRDDDGQLRLVGKDPAKAWIVDPTDALTERVWEVARACHVALGCRHYSLFDFRIDPSGQPWFLEAGLYCSFAPDSVIATMARAAGISLAELFESAVSLARA